MLATMLLVQRLVAEKQPRRGGIGNIGRAKLQNGRRGRLGRQRDPVARRELLARDRSAVDGEPVAAPQIADAPAVGFADDLGVFAGKVRRVEDQVANDAAADEDAGLLERLHDLVSGRLKD